MDFSFSILWYVVISLFCSHQCLRLECPRSGFIKLNFDGASKGNPRKIGYGGVFRTCEGKILGTYMGVLGIDCNNAAKLWALYTSLNIVKQQCFSRLIIEGDSNILIDMLRHLHNGKSPAKLSTSWFLEHFLTSMGILLRDSSITVTLSHV